MVLVLQEEAGNEQHEDEGRQGDGKGGCGTAEDAHPVGTSCIDDGGVAYVGGGIDANGSGCHLRDGDDVGEFTHRHPMVVRDDFALYHREHGIATAETEEAYEEEGDEELEKEHLEDWKIERLKN